MAYQQTVYNRSNWPVTTRRSSMAFVVGGPEETFRCYVCGTETGVGHSHRLDQPSICPAHCEDHEYEDGTCLYCGHVDDRDPFDDYYD